MMRRFTSAPKPAARVRSYSSVRSWPSLAQAEAHAVIAREIRRGLGRRDDVIGRQPIFRVRQRHVHDLGAGVAQPVQPLLPQPLDLGRHAVGAVFARHADAQPPHAASAGGGIIRHRHDRRWCCPSGRSPAMLRQQDRAILHGARERPGLVQRRGERHHAPAAAAAIGRLDARQCRRTPPAGGSSRRYRCPWRPCAIRAATAAADPPDEPPGTSTRIAVAAPLPRIFHRAERRCHVGRAHRELVQIGLAQEHRAVAQQVAR